MCGQLKPGKRKIQKKEEVVNLILITKEAKEAKSARGEGWEVTVLQGWVPI